MQDFPIDTFLRQQSLALQVRAFDHVNRICVRVQDVPGGRVSYVEAVEGYRERDKEGRKIFVSTLSSLPDGYHSREGIAQSERLTDQFLKRNRLGWWSLTPEQQALFPQEKARREGQELNGIFARFAKRALARVSSFAAKMRA